jgi:hypothetical protein
MAEDKKILMGEGDIQRYGDEILEPSILQWFRRKCSSTTGRVEQRTLTKPFDTEEH